MTQPQTQNIFKPVSLVLCLCRHRDESADAGEVDLEDEHGGGLPRHVGGGVVARCHRVTLRA